MEAELAINVFAERVIWAFTVNANLKTRATQTPATTTPFAKQMVMASNATVAQVSLANGATHSSTAVNRARVSMAANAVYKWAASIDAVVHMVGLAKTAPRYRPRVKMWQRGNAFH